MATMHIFGGVEIEVCGELRVEATEGGAEFFVGRGEDGTVYRVAVSAVEYIEESDGRW